MKKLLLLLTFLGAFIALPDAAQAQSQERLDELEDKKEQNERQEAAAYEAGKRRHLALQDKATRKRMKRKMREANRRAAGKPVRRGQGWRNLFKKKRF